MYISVNRHPCSYVFIMISTRGHVSQFCYSDLHMYCYVTILSWLCVPLFIFTLGYICTCSTLNLSCIPMLIFTPGHVLLYWYSHLVMYLCVVNLTWLNVPILKFIVVHHLCWYLQVFMYLRVDIHTWSCVLLLIFTLGNVSLCWYFPMVMWSSLDIYT